MPRTFRKNLVKFNPEALIYECELVDNQINIQQPALTANKQGRWDLLQEIKTGVMYGFVQVNNSRHRLFKYDDQFYMLVENKNHDKIPDGQKIQGRLIVQCSISEEESSPPKRGRKHKNKITYLDKEDNEPKKAVDCAEPASCKGSSVTQTEVQHIEGEELQRPKITMSPMTYSAILPEFDAVVVPETEPWRDFELI